MIIKQTGTWACSLSGQQGNSMIREKRFLQFWSCCSAKRSWVNHAFRVAPGYLLIAENFQFSFLSGKKLNNETSANYIAIRLSPKFTDTLIIILSSVPSFQQTAIYLPIFWPADLSLIPSDIQHLQIDTSGEPWGAFSAVKQTNQH